MTSVSAEAPHSLQAKLSALSDDEIPCLICGSSESTMLNPKSPLCRGARTAPSGDGYVALPAAQELVELSVEQGDIESLREQSEDGN